MSEERAILLPFESKTSNSSMQGSYRFVLRMVNRTFRALTVSNLSTFNEALTGGRSKPERALGTKSAKARSISLIRNLSFFCSLFKTSDPGD